MRKSSQEKRIRIIEAATSLFIKQGYRDTSLDQIVSICGGSKQTLYRYFSNKEGLFIEVLAHNTKNNLEPVFQLEYKKDDLLCNTLERFAKEYLLSICSNPLLSLFRIVSADFNMHNSIPNQFWETGPQCIHQYLIDFLASDEVKEYLDIDDPELACNQFLALIKLDYQNKALLGYGIPNKSELSEHAKKAVIAFMSLYGR